MPRKSINRIAMGGVIALVASFAFTTSDAYASIVTGVTASTSTPTAGAPATYTIDFSTSSTGALGSGAGTITLAGPAGTQFPLTASDYSINGSLVTVTPTDSAANNVTITTPVPISSSTPVVVVAGIGATATNTTGAQSASLTVKTSVDSTPVASSPTYTIVAGPATQDVETAGNGQTATVGVAYSIPLSATIEDQFGNPILVSGSTVTFTAPGSGASGTFTNGTNTTAAVTNGSGVATATTYTASTTAGPSVVTASSIGLTGDFFTETNVAAAGSQVVSSAGSGQNASIGTSFTTLFGATVEDSHGNPVLIAGTTVTFTAPASGPSGTFLNGTNTTSAVTNVSGVATATTYTANATTGAYTVTASSSGLSTANLNETNVTAAFKVVITAGGSQSAFVGTSFTTNISATVEDSSSVPVPVAGRTVTFTGPATGASGTFVNGTNTTAATTNGSGVATATTYTANTTAGPDTVSATSVALAGAATNDTNVAGTASQNVVTSGAGQSVTVSNAFGTALSVTIEDVHGNPVLVSGTNVTFTAPASGASGNFANGTRTTVVATNTSGVAVATTLTANTTSGPYSVTAGSAGSTSASFNETNVAGSPTQVILTVGSGQSAPVGTPFAAPFGATIEDAQGNPVLVGGTTVTFTAPSNGASGTFVNGTDTTAATTNTSGVAVSTAFTADMVGGTYTVAASSNGLITANFSESNSTAPDAPTNLTATLGNATITLAWVPPANNGGSAITGYDIYEGTSSGGESVNPIASANLAACNSSSGPSHCTVIGLANGTTYYFTVKAVNVLGLSVASNGASATPATSAIATIVGYDLVAADGGVFGLGSSGYYGSEGGKRLQKPIVAMVVTPDGGGYWLVASDGGIFTFGNAQFFGSEGGKHLSKPIVGMAVTANGGGYWLVASDGGIFAFGNAQFYGSEGGKRLDRPIVGIAADVATGGYWMVASDGGIFSFNAPFAGSTGGTHLNKPIVEMAADPVTGGYWMVASDGGIFSFGGARFYGSEGATPLNQPIVAMVADRSTGGYWLVASDGGIFSFNAPFSGSLGGTRLSQPIVGMSTS